MKYSLSLFIILILSNTIHAQVSHRDFVVADSLAKRLSPSAFSILPAGIKAALTRGGYTIPQSWADSLPHNVIFGEFRKKGQIDCAVLASRNRVSSILIFWDCSENDTTHIESRADLNYMQHEGEDGILFSRYLQTVRAIQAGWECLDNEGRRIHVDHDVIDDYFIPKASVMHYYKNGKWYLCQGAD